MPLLDTKLLARLASGRKHETYYPIAVADDKFHCIILKGGDQYPYFPRPLLSEFEFSVPLASAPPKGDGEDGDENGDGEDTDAVEERALAQQFVAARILAAQLRDGLGEPGAGHAERSRLGRVELEMDKTLLRMLAMECRLGEERGMRALEAVELMGDRTGRMLEAAGKVADRYDRVVLAEKIREIGERRVNGMDEDE